VVNGGGHVVREYALGTGRPDIFVRHFYQVQGKRAEQRFVVEIKVVRANRSLETTLEEWLAQTAKYADKCSPDEAHLVVVDPSNRSWDEKIFVRECVGWVLGDAAGATARPIMVWWM